MRRTGQNALNKLAASRRDSTASLLATPWRCASSAPWKETWNPAGERVFRHSTGTEYTERWEGGVPVVYETHGKEAVEVRYDDLPFDIACEAEWATDDGDTFTHKQSGCRWAVQPSGLFRNAATGEVRRTPLPCAASTDLSISLKELSFCHVVSDLSIRQRVAGSSVHGVDDEYRIVKAESAHIRVEEGPLVELAEIFRAALTTYESIDLTHLRRCVEKMASSHPSLKEYVLKKLADVRQHLQNASDEHESEFDSALQILEQCLRAISAHRGSRPVGRRGILPGGTAPGPVLFQTHLLSLSFNPLMGLSPLFPPGVAEAYLRRTATLISAYEATRNMAAEHEAGCLSEAVADASLALRRLRHHSRFYRGVDGVRKLEKSQLLFYGSAVHNTFLFWSSVRPGGYPLNSRTAFIDSILRGVFGSYAGFRTNLKMQAEVAGPSGGWVWLAVDMSRVKRSVGDVRRFSDPNKAKLEDNETRDIALLGETGIVMRDAVEQGRGRVLGYDIQIMTSFEQDSALPQGFYPLAGVELWPPAMGGRTPSQFIDDWLRCLDWRVVEFQLRSCYREKLEDTGPAYACIQTLNSDRLHAVWLDILAEGTAAPQLAAVAQGFYSARGNLAALMGKRFAQVKQDPDLHGITAFREVVAQAPAGVSEAAPHDSLDSRGLKKASITTGKREEAKGKLLRDELAKPDEDDADEFAPDVVDDGEVGVEVEGESDFAATFDAVAIDGEEEVVSGGGVSAVGGEEAAPLGGGSEGVASFWALGEEDGEGAQPDAGAPEAEVAVPSEEQTQRAKLPPSQTASLQPPPPPPQSSPQRQSPISSGAPRPPGSRTTGVPGPPQTPASSPQQQSPMVSSGAPPPPAGNRPGAVPGPPQTPESASQRQSPALPGAPPPPGSRTTGVPFPPQTPGLSSQRQSPMVSSGAPPPPAGNRLGAVPGPPQTPASSPQQQSPMVSPGAPPPPAGNRPVAVPGPPQTPASSPQQQTPMVSPGVPPPPAGSRPVAVPGPPQMPESASLRQSPTLTPGAPPPPVGRRGGALDPPQPPPRGRSEASHPEAGLSPALRVRSSPPGGRGQHARGSGHRRPEEGGKMYHGRGLTPAARSPTAPPAESVGGSPPSVRFGQVRQVRQVSEQEVGIPTYLQVMTESERLRLQHLLTRAPDR